MSASQLHEPDIENVPNKVGNYWRSRRALRKLALMAGNLRNKGRDIWRKAEMLVGDEVAADSTKIDSAEEVFQIEVQYVSLPAMNGGIRQDRVSLPKAVRQALLNAQCRLDLAFALLKKISKLLLCKLQLRKWHVDGALTA